MNIKQKIQSINEKIQDNEISYEQQLTIINQNYTNNKTELKQELNNIKQQYEHIAIQLAKQRCKLNISHTETNITDIGIDVIIYIYIPQTMTSTPFISTVTWEDILYHEKIQNDTTN